MWCGKVVVVKRSAMERMALARYFALTWKRTQPLWAYHGNQPAELRSAGRDEASRVRVNEAPYSNFHGMSLPPSGFALDERWRSTTEKPKRKTPGYSMMMELQWVQDPSANVENWFLTDIEKILNEAWQLNPHGPESNTLAGEMHVSIGQNPKIGSSIQKTQHTQLCDGKLSKYPVLSLSSNAGPLFSKKLDASLDFVCIQPAGTPLSDTGFFLKVLTSHPTNPALVKFLVELRLHLLAKFGGVESIDFLVMCMSDDATGGFVVLFAPISQLTQLTPGSADLAVFANPHTGESTETAQLEEGRIDFGKGIGQFLCMKPALKEQLLANGEDTMKKLWAFNRVPGMVEAVHEFSKIQSIFSD
jgi:hypothetical protein